MTQSLHTEAEQTRALWRDYRRTTAAIMAWGDWPNDPERVGGVVLLLREQKRILNELIPEEK
jgi:hypothetical protein